MDLVIWGIIIIVTTAISAIGIAFGIYYMLTKTKKKKETKKADYKLEDQEEIS